MLFSTLHVDPSTISTKRQLVAAHVQFKPRVPNWTR